MREYLKEPIVGIIAPAGYGKTEEIANAVMCCEGKQLILTHTKSWCICFTNANEKEEHCE